MRPSRRTLRRRDLAFAEDVPRAAFSTDER